MKFANEILLVTGFIFTGVFHELKIVANFHQLVCCFK